MKSTKFLVDAQLPPSLCRMLREKGLVSEHVAEVLRPNAPDSFVALYAQENGCVILTKDSDFATRVLIDKTHPPVVWVRWPNSRPGRLAARLEPMLGTIVEAIKRGERLVELR